MQIKDLVITALISIALTGFLTREVVEAKHVSQYEVFEKRQAVRDSIIRMDSIAIRELQIERDSLSFVQNEINFKLDSTIAIIKSHVKITVTDNDVIDALSWIRDTHGVLDPTIE
tara:strand:- start:8368 stop:8712 length:345 start_codon:yes stop_codon:yes gene_type:complete